VNGLQTDNPSHFEREGMVAVIRVAAVALLAYTGCPIVRPFTVPILWGIIMSAAPTVGEHRGKPCAIC